MDTGYLQHVQYADSAELYHLMSQYGDDVWRYAYAITKNHEQSKDIAQEVFMKVHEKLTTFRGQCSFQTWLFAITRNIALNHMRSGYFRKILLLDHVASKQTAPSAESTFIENEAAAEIRNIVMGLSRKLREVLLLHLEHELSMREMAQLLRVSEGTVKSRLSRARSQVERKWRELGHE